MIVPEFIRFYGYSLDKTLDEKAKVFFSLVNSMYRIQASETLNLSAGVAVGMGDKDIQKKLVDKTGGLSKIIKEVRSIKR